jgi:urease accessory protein
MSTEAKGTDRRGAGTSRLGAALAGVVLVVAAGPASAHVLLQPGAGFAAGLAHPFSGIDHLLAMMVVGAWAAQLGGRAMVWVPLSFVAAMCAGGAVGFLWPGPAHEVAVAATVALLGGFVAFAFRPSVTVAAVLVALMAVAHGHAHASELPIAASPLAYSAGFVLATATLHGLGLGIGRVARSGASAQWMRHAGAAISMVGVLLVLARW